MEGFKESCQRASIVVTEMWCETYLSNQVWSKCKIKEKAQSLWDGSLLDIWQNYSHKLYIHSGPIPLGCHHARSLCSALAERACYPPLCVFPRHSQPPRYVTREACTHDLWPRVGVACAISVILGMEPVSREPIATIEWEIISRPWLPTTKNNTFAQVRSTHTTFHDSVEFNSGVFIAPKPSELPS